MGERERERERERCRATRVTLLRTADLKHDFETCESIRIVRRQNRKSYINIFLLAPLVFSSSSLMLGTQHKIIGLILGRFLPFVLWLKIFWCVVCGHSHIAAHHTLGAKLLNLGFVLSSCVWSLKIL